MKYVNFIFCLVTGHICPEEGHGGNFKDDIWDFWPGVRFFAGMVVDYWPKEVIELDMKAGYNPVAYYLKGQLFPKEIEDVD